MSNKIEQTPEAFVTGYNRYHRCHYGFIWSKFHSMASSEELAIPDQQQQFQMSIQHCVDKIVKSVSNDKQFTSGYVQALSEFLFQFTSRCVSRDLIAFKKHGGRKSLSPDDVLLVARKTNFKDHLQVYLRDKLGVDPRASPTKRKGASKTIDDLWS